MGATSGRGPRNGTGLKHKCTSGGEWARHRISNCDPRDAAPAWTLLVNSRTARRLHNTKARPRRRRRVGTRCPSEARSTAATPQRPVGSGTGRTTRSALPEGAAHLWALFSRRRAVSVDGQDSRPRGLGLGVPRHSTRAAPRARGHCSRGCDRTGGGGTCAVAQSRLHVVAGAVSVSRYPIRVLGAWDLDVLIVLHLVAQLDLETLPRQGAAAGELSLCI